MNIEGKEYSETITLNNFETAMFVAKYNDYQYIMRLIGGIKYKENGKKFESLTFAINIDDDNDEILKLIIMWEWTQFYEKNKEKLFQKFLDKELKIWNKMNGEFLQSKYFRLENNKELIEIKGEINNG